ncbi:TPA: DUF202 domain-containing protein [Pseudomonas putida]|jgi:uncharacterized membrane protein YidH (DUF202 family)|uniref:DUF202 domain-containing protein n=1 Tax=Pseudomonas TaxID=286 RepID=UPI000487CD46|nr:MULTISPECIES: DUF202 domain-containing protein [Pseudomonas]MDD2154468.1 DUF202 domain-containing protein [Pseudomonas putida]RAS21418.1 uncharacterized protein DUF202 [Pseudomonas sp. URMO17WK12:I7]SMF72157.1 protein of unknown function [Pseudomonas sp. URMO17WK12:I5]HDS1683493.1 DUF202 domain-containing protein [Pseudomonas putida]
MPDPQLAHADEGLQPERTLLAWRRTIMAMVVCSCFFLRWVPHHRWLAVAPAVLCLLAAGAAWLRLRRRYRRHVTGLRAETIASGITVNLLLAACVTALCAIELIAILAW